MTKYLTLALLLSAAVLPGCKRDAASAPGTVVLYTSVDEPYARKIVQRFEQQTGIKVTLVTDAEANKTAGLAERLEAEKANPQADVYWGNEIFHTINLAQRGAFAPYRSPAAADIPDRWRGADDLYASAGLRARLLVVSTLPKYQPLVAKIKGINDLTDPALKGRIAIANPGVGTTSGHVAALYVVLGKDRFEQLMRGLRANDVKLLGGNSTVVEQVGAGTLIAGLTDNDDVNNAKADNQPVDGVVPDQDLLGALLVPTTIALVNGAPRSENGKKLIDFLLAPEVENELIAGRFLAYSVRTAEKQVKAMDVDYARVAREMRTAVELALTILQDRAPGR